MQVFKKLMFQAVATMALFVSMTIPALGADVTGSWAMTVQTDAGAGMMGIILEQVGADIKGSITGDAGNAPVNGKVEDEVVTFTHDLPDYGISASYRGTMEGNTIKGTVDFGNGAAMGTFSAERKE